MKKFSIAASVALAAAALVATSGIAQASATIDSTGHGFVGKGDVQSAFGWANKALQDNAESLKFSTSQATSQVLTQALTQSATRVDTQAVGQDVTCTLTNGNGSKVFHRDGERSGVATGTAQGTATGSVTGSLAGSLSSDVNYTARKQNQFTGFNLNGFVPPSPVYTAGATTWGPDAIGDFVFGDAAFGDVEWGGWIAEPGDNPADCLGGNPGISALVDIVTPGLITEGTEVTPGAVDRTAPIDRTAPVLPAGPIVVSVTFGGVTKAL